jgi:stress-induced morphogen
MPIRLRTKRPDRVLREIVDALQTYAEAHPQAAIEVYRHSNVSVRIRIVDPQFAKQSRAEREVEVWAALEQLSEETSSEISLLLLLTPAETKKSLANLEFDDPVPSGL